MRKRLLFVLIVVLLVAAVSLTACRKKPSDPSVKTIYDVSMGTIAVGTAIEKAVQLEGAENVYLSFTFVVDKGADEYKEVYDFTALLDLDDDQNCTLSFKNYTDIVNVISTEVYYKNGTLYLNRQPAVDRAAVSGVSLSQIASTLVTSAQKGQVGSVLQLLPALGDRVFSSCERTQEGDKNTYVFTVDYEEIGTCISYLVAQTGLLNVADMTRLLGLNDLNSADVTTISFVTRTVDGVGEVFLSADCRTTTESGTESETTTSKGLTAFTCKVLSDAAATQPQYQVNMPDNLSSFGYAHPANLNLTGTMTFGVNSNSRAAYLSAQPLQLSFSNYRYDLDYSLLSNVDAMGKWTASLVLTNRSDRSRYIGAYVADNTLYLDLSALSMGCWQLPAAKIQEIAVSLGRSREAQTLTAAQYRDLIFDLLVDRVEESEQVTYTLKADTIVKLYNAVQETLTANTVYTLPPIAVDNATVVVNTQNNAFRTLTVSASIWGADVVIEATNPTVGKSVTVATPAWVETCVNPLTATTITPVAKGVVSSYSAANSNVALLEALLYSVSGTRVSLGSKEIKYYNFAANLSGGGKLNAFSVDFYDAEADRSREGAASEANRVCSLYYHTDSPDKLYVIMPTTGVETRVVTLTIRDEMRYVEFVRAINGNAEIRQDLAACTLANTQSTFSFTWSNAGLKALLGRLSGILSEQTVTDVPNDLGVQSLCLTLGADSSLCVNFAANRFLAFDIDDFAITDASLALTTNERQEDVSYFDTYNLTQQLNVTIGDGDTARRNLTVTLADLDTQWAFVHEPALGSGKQLVTAYSTAFGQRVNLDFGVDCTCPSEVEVQTAASYADYLDAASKTFTFDRYGVVSPTDVVSKFNRVKVVVGASTLDIRLYWLRGDKEITSQDSDWSSPRNDGNTSDYVILPAVTNFFGKPVSLSSAVVGGQARTLAGEYTLRLSGAPISTIKNVATYLTIETYGDKPYDPFDVATYDSGDLVFRTANDLPVEGVSADNWQWDVSSIKNKEKAEGGICDSKGKLYDTDALVEAMHSNLYALNGKYAIDLNIINALGVSEKSIHVTITVRPYVIASVAFGALASDDVSYVAESGEYMAKFTVQPCALTEIGSGFVFAGVVTATFGNGETHDFLARDWTVEPVSKIVMFKGYSGKAKLTVGDDAGGRQIISLRYEVLAEPVDSVALWGWKKGAKQEIAGTAKNNVTPQTTSLSFALTDLDPYDFVMPAGLAVHSSSGVQYVEHTFSFPGWNDNDLWHSTTAYTTTEDVYNVSVTLSMSFVPMYVTGDWRFAGYVEDDLGAFVFDKEGGDFIAYVQAKHAGQQRYTKISYVTYTPSKSGAFVQDGETYVPYNEEQHGNATRYTEDTILVILYAYEENDLGDYVCIGGKYTAYNPVAHAGQQRYAKVESATVYYRKGIDGTDRLVIDPNKVDYLDKASYPALVVVEFEPIADDKGDFVQECAKDYNGDFVKDETFVEDAQGAYVQNGTAYVPYNKEQHGSATRYRKVVSYVAYDENKHAGQQRYNSKVVYVPYNETEHAGQQRYRKAYAALPAVWDLTALAKINPEDDYTGTVKLSIPMSQYLDDVYMRIESTRPRFTYYKVDMAELTDEHGDTYYEPVIEDGFYVGGVGEVTLTLLGTDDGGNLVVNDLTSERRMHDLICGCGDPECKGYLYFDYGDSTTANARFAITQWKGLNNIAEALKQAAKAHPDTPIQELSFDVEIIAVAHAIENKVLVHVQASQMSDVRFTEAGMPRPASSIYSGGADIYSMTADPDSTALTVDPYVADVFDPANYPQQIGFKLGDVAGLSYVDWDLSALAGVTPYEGASVVVYAEIDTDYGKVRIAAPLTVKRRIIASVTVDGSTDPVLYVNAMSSRPFGTELMRDGDKVYACKKVTVKFEQEDLPYQMDMRYDVTGYVASYKSKELSADTTILVGNEAGGFQAIGHYRVFTKDNYVMRIRVTEPEGGDDTDAHKSYEAVADYIPDGGEGCVLYAYNALSGVFEFVTFDDSDAANTAWRALTTGHLDLALDCGYIDEGNVLHTTTYTAEFGTEALGVGYAWERATMGGKTVLRLKVTNVVDIPDEFAEDVRMDALQYVSTGTNRYINLTRAMLKIKQVDGVTIDLDYDSAYTVGALLAAHALEGVNGELFAIGDLTIAVYAAADTTFASPLGEGDVLGVGSYVWRIAIDEQAETANPYYRGAVDITVNIARRELTAVKVSVVQGETADNATLVASGYTYSRSSGKTLDIVATDNACAINVVYYDSEHTLLASAPEAVGTYTVALVPEDSGYVVDLGGGKDSFTLTITA